MKKNNQECKTLHVKTETIQKTIHKDISNNIALLNYHWENINFGAVLTAFALNYFLNQKGYNAQNIDYIPHFPWIMEEEPNAYFDEFRHKYMPQTSRYDEVYQLEELNGQFKHFIVGSDQVWRYDFILHDLDAFFFNFANNDKNLIAYAASFGVDNIQSRLGENNELVKKYISNFNSVGVREESGINYCEDNNIQATQVIDPVFLLEKSVWDNIIENDDTPKEKHDIVFYTINEHMADEIIEYVNKNQKILHTNTIKNVTFKTSIEEWLFQLKNCKFFITDSFHGVCFAIIFNKPFICVNKNALTSTRMESLFKFFKIKNRLYNTFEEIPLSTVIEDEIDYQSVKSILETNRKISSDWLLSAISNMVENHDKQMNKIDIAKLRYKNAKKDILKYFSKYMQYNLYIRLFKNNMRYRKKYYVNRTAYKECKKIIKYYGKQGEIDE